MGWWSGMNFSIGAQEARRQLQEDIESAQDFIESITDKEEISDSDKELKERLEKALEDDKNDLITESEIKTIEKFVLFWQSLHEDRSLDERFEDAVESQCYLFGGMGIDGESEMMRYYPEKYNKKLPKNGGWIIVTSIPGVVVEAQPELFGVYYAKAVPIKKQISVAEFARNRIRVYDYYKVKINTLFGELCLWPHEYSLISNIDDVLDGVGEEYEMVKLGGDTNYDQSKVHYLGTRGISQAEVYQMLMGSINSTTFAFFRLASQEYKDYYQFFFDCTNKGIRPDMVPRLWESQQTGKPLFKVKYVKHDKDGKEVEIDKAEFEGSKNQKEGDLKEDQLEG